MSEEINKIGTDNQSEGNQYSRTSIQNTFPIGNGFLVSIIVCLAIAFVYLKYTTPVYNVFCCYYYQKMIKRVEMELVSFLYSKEWGLLGGENNVDNGK